MPLIQKPKRLPEQVQAKFKLSHDANAAINAYAKWADITPDYFIEQAALMVFEKDRDWKEFSRKNPLPKSIVA